MRNTAKERQSLGPVSLLPAPHPGKEERGCWKPAGVERLKSRAQPGDHLQVLSESQGNLQDTGGKHTPQLPTASAHKVSELPRKHGSPKTAPTPSGPPRMCTENQHLRGTDKRASKPSKLHGEGTGGQDGVLCKYPYPQIVLNPGPEAGLGIRITVPTAALAQDRDITCGK